jgi:fido (protein-threonine AMPylation protein)
MPRADEWKPGCPEWVTETNSPLAEIKRRLVLEKLVTEDYLQLPSVDLVLRWHADLFTEIAPCSDYVGCFRDKEQTTYCLQGYEVVVGDVDGVSAANVLDEVDSYFLVFKKKVLDLDKMFSSKNKSSITISTISRVVELAAWAHGEWVRIHPFANGNGRTARLIANYVLVRYGFGPALVLKPRPDQPYGIAARRSMKYHDHKMMEDVIWAMLEKSYQRSS